MAVPGYQAVFQLGPTTYTSVNGLDSVEVSTSQDIYDISDLGNGAWKKKLPGMVEYSLKIGGFFDLSNAQIATLNSSIVTTPGQSVTWKLEPIGAGTGNPVYSGSGFIKTQGIKIAVKNEQQVTWDIEGSGALVSSIL